MHVPIVAAKYRVPNGTKTAWVNMKPRIGGTKPQWKPKRPVHCERVIDKVVVKGQTAINSNQDIWDHTFYIEQWGEFLIAVNEYTNKGRAKVFSEQFFNVFQRYCEIKKEISYYYTPARNGVAPCELKFMDDLLRHAPWENLTIGDSFPSVKNDRSSD